MNRRKLGLALAGFLLGGVVRLVRPSEGEVLVIKTGPKFHPGRWQELAFAWRKAGGHSVVMLHQGEEYHQEDRQLSGEDRGLPK